MSDLEQSDIELGDLDIDSDNEDIGNISKLSVNVPLASKNINNTNKDHI